MKEQTISMIIYLPEDVFDLLMLLKSTMNPSEYITELVKEDFNAGFSRALRKKKDEEGDTLQVRSAKAVVRGEFPVVLEHEDIIKKKQNPYIE